MLADYQLAYNGIKVRIDAQAARRSSPALPSVLAVRALERCARQRPGRPADRRPARVGRPAGLHGESIKVAIIDTGIDYTHANFGGPGTVAAYTAANATDTLPPIRRGSAASARASRAASTSSATPTTPSRTRRRSQPIPQPDPNPLDCNGHGSHVAGSAAGSGVLATGDDVQRRVQRHHDHRQQLDDRPRRRAEGRHLRRPRLRLRRLDRRHGRRDRVGGRRTTWT